MGGKRRQAGGALLSFSVIGTKRRLVPNHHVPPFPLLGLGMQFERCELGPVGDLRS
jgi:hypothetical protein